MKKVLILGCGALGSNLAANLAADLRNEIELTVLDYDKIEERNVQAGTQFYMPDQIGQSKVDALQYNIYKWFGVEVQIEKVMLGDDNLQLLSKYDLIIDCFDNEASRERVQEALNTEILGSLLHCGFSPKMTFEISWADNYEVPEDNKKGIDICEMPGAASFIKMVTGIAGRTVMQFVVNKEKRYFVGNRFSFHEIA